MPLAVCGISRLDPAYVLLQKRGIPPPAFFKHRRLPRYFCANDLRPYKLLCVFIPFHLIPELKHGIVTAVKRQIQPCGAALFIAENNIYFPF